ncbi:hypothetical protein [Microscilla marina]|uniref:Uncharacterized protein n=1 Tax=Microscilla marina ATCC 23134 TaxID=313606 RepID=A1ZHT4_MICM2|nr:hypothetical protein [Microscilla marina]EAY30091.1 hypothetical protein M23134_05424 [Microscilla marina ATCC 23134]
MEYKNFKFGTRSSKVQAHRDTISAEEFQSRLNFYKKKYEAEQKARNEALLNNHQEQTTPLVELNQSDTEETTIPLETDEAQNEEAPLEVDRLFLQRNDQAEGLLNNEGYVPAPEKLYTSAQGKQPRH